MEPDLDVVGPAAERELVNKIRGEYFSMKAVEEKNAEMDKLQEQQKEDTKSVKNRTLTNMTFDFNGKPINIKQFTPANINTAVQGMTYEIGGQMLGDGGPSGTSLRGRKASVKSLSSKQKSVASMN